MTYLSLFSGAGGLDRALPGHAVAHVEIDPRLTMEKEHRRPRLRLTGNGVVTETAALVFRTML